MAERPLIDRLHDLEHVLLVDKLLLFAKDVVEARERIQHLERLLASVDVDLSPVARVTG